MEGWNMGDYDHFPLIETSIRREWFRYPFFFYVRNGDIYRTIYRAEYRKSGKYGDHVQIDDVGDWVEIVLLDEQIGIRYAIF